jgi:hypothetical protein
VSTFRTNTSIDCRASPWTMSSGVTDASNVCAAAGPAASGTALATRRAARARVRVTDPLGRLGGTADGTTRDGMCLLEASTTVVVCSARPGRPCPDCRRRRRRAGVATGGPAARPV